MEDINNNSNEPPEELESKDMNNELRDDSEAIDSTPEETPPQANEEEGLIPPNASPEPTEILVIELPNSEKITLGSFSRPIEYLVDLSLRVLSYIENFGENKKPKDDRRYIQ